MFKCKVILRYSKGKMIAVKDSSALDMAINQPLSHFWAKIYTQAFMTKLPY